MPIVWSRQRPHYTQNTHTHMLRTWKQIDAADDDNSRWLNGAYFISVLVRMVVAHSSCRRAAMSFPLFLYLSRFNRCIRFLIPRRSTFDSSAKNKQLELYTYYAFEIRVFHGNRNYQRVDVIKSNWLFSLIGKKTQQNGNKSKYVGSEWAS